MKQQEKRGRRNQVGGYGETIVAQYLANMGFVLRDTNYLKPWGEIDVIVEKNDRVHFVEVKTVSYGTKEALEYVLQNESWNPEDNVDRRKLIKLSRVIESWLSENSWEGEWCIDVAAVRIVTVDKYATIKMIEGVVLE